MAPLLQSKTAEMAVGSFGSWPSSYNTALTTLKPPPPTLSLGPCPTLSCRYTSPHELSPSLIDKTLSDISNSGVIACLRAPSAELAMKAAHTALRGGISVLEIVTSSPGVFEVVKQLVHDYPATAIGVGTVLNSKDAKNAIDAGAKFLMSPAMVKEIMDVVQGGDVLYIPGVMTPTEILSAYSAGAKIVKIYPISALGGSQYISALNKPFSHIPMVASQGIKIDLIAEYIAQGATSVVLSDAIFDKEAMGQQSFKTIYQLAHLAAMKGKKAVEGREDAKFNWFL